MSRANVYTLRTGNARNDSNQCPAHLSFSLGSLRFQCASRPYYRDASRVIVADTSGEWLPTDRGNAPPDLFGAVRPARAFPVAPFESAQLHGAL